MTSTLATENQADAIKRRMAEVRTELPYSADAARLRVGQLVDWKYHLTRHPLPFFAAAVAAGYLLVPSKRPSAKFIVERVSESNVPSSASSKSVAGGIAGAVATIVLRQATSMAASQIGSLLNRREET